MKYTDKSKLQHPQKISPRDFGKVRVQKSFMADAQQMQTAGQQYILCYHYYCSHRQANQSAIYSR